MELALVGQAGLADPNPPAQVVDGIAALQSFGLDGSFTCW
jgi:hypothetical protein